MLGHSSGLDRRGSISRSRKYKSVQDSCNWRTRALSAQFFREDKRVTQKALCRILHSAVSSAGLGRGQPRENSYGLGKLTVRPPLIPGAVDGQGGAGMLDIDEEHLAVGREGRAGEFGIVHAVVPEAVELAGGRYAD